MEASEAKRLFLQNKKGIDFVYEQIKAQAEYGNNYATFPDTLDNTIITKLINNGYEISKFTDQYGVDVTKVKW